MERRYVGVLTVGRLADVFDKIHRIVKTKRLTRIIPRVKFEKRARGQFYVFLAVDDSTETLLPRSVETVLELAGLRGVQHWPLTPGQIQSMTDGTELETHSLNALKYNSLWSKDVGDPFDLSDSPSHEEDIDDSSLGERFNRLLNWLSANAEGTWQTFARVCDILQLAGNVKDARSVFRRLILLGYIESSSDGQKWSICPATLVQCATEPEVCFLTGQRIPRLIKQLDARWNLENLPQPGNKGPSRVKVHINPSVDSFVNELQVESVGVASVQLASLLPDLEGWKAILSSIDRISTTRYDIEIWNGSRFSPCDAFYERSGMYRLTRRNDTNAYQLVLYLDQPNQRWLRGDWYGLRFLAYDSVDRNFEVVYDYSTNDLLIPVDGRWPLLYERALVLASGSLPARVDNPRRLKYSGISSELVQLLTEKLNVSIVEV